MEMFGIIGMTFGTMGYVFAMIAIKRINKLERELKTQKLLDDDFSSQ